MFDAFVLDLDRARLSRHGQELPLRPKSFDVLRYLAEHAGRLVTREELLGAVWPDVVVTEDSVAQCLIELRRSLGDDHRRMIRTVPRRGVIFDLPIRFETGDEAPAGPMSQASGRRGWLAAAALAAAAVLVFGWVHVRRNAGDAGGIVATGRPKIAVLRFVDLSPGGDLGYLAEGISEEIMIRLGDLRSLDVIARASSFAVDGQRIAAIARSLGLTHVLEGSVRAQGDRLRVTAKLIDTASSALVWSRSYDLGMVQVPQVQREIANEVAAALRAGPRTRAETANVEPRAYQLFLEGQHFYRRRADGDLARARQRYEQALAIEPAFARAWVGLSAALTALHATRVGAADVPDARDSLFDALRQATEQALRYGPELPEAHVRAARFQRAVGDLVRARGHIETARALDPGHWLVQATIATELRLAGRIDESIDLTRRDVQRDPLNLVLRENLVAFLTWAGRHPEARAEIGRIDELMPRETQSRNLMAHRVRVALLTGDRASAEAGLPGLDGDRDGEALHAMVQDALGRRSVADARLQRLVDVADDGWGALAVAEVYARRGNHALAMTWLDKVAYGYACVQANLAQRIYYSPFLAGMAGVPGWEARRHAALGVMQACRLGLSL